ncbi:hypothetical protein Tco_0804032 [Tanacetum coccineum]|uniref:Uncharacterized protein n=1 Tax=Tanacetum coccineum TaxID=301880 RepID=A0ABQ5A386_9ASTR
MDSSRLRSCGLLLLHLKDDRGGIRMCLTAEKQRKIGVVGRKIPESPWGSPIPIGDGDGDVNRFPDGDGDGDGDGNSQIMTTLHRLSKEHEKKVKDQGYGSVSRLEKRGKESCSGHPLLLIVAEKDHLEKRLYWILRTQQSTTIEGPSSSEKQIPATNPPTTLPDFTSVFRFNDRITALEKEVAKIKKDPLHTQVTSLVNEHLDTRLGETREEFMNFLSESLTARIKEQVKDQLPQILPKEVSNFTPPVIEKLIKESRDEVTLAKVSSQPQSTYKAASTLTEFELKKILLDKMEKSESYLTAPEHRDCYDGLKKSYALDKDFFYSYDLFSLKRGRKDKDKDKDPSPGSDRGLKKRKTSKYAEPTTCQKKKDSASGSSKGTKSQLKSSGNSVQSEEPVFKVADSDMPQDQEENLGDNEDEPRKETAFRRDWFKKPTPPQEPTDPDWILARLLRKDQLKIGPAFRLLKGTRSNYAELEYDFEECYKALSEKLDWENPEGGDYPFDLSKPLPLIKRGKRQRVPFEFFINNDLKYLQGGISTMTYTTSTTKTKAAKYDLPGIEDMVPNIWSPVKVAYDRYALWVVTHVKVMRKHGYGYLEEIVVRRADNILYKFKEGDFLRLRINDIEDMLILVVQNWLTNLSGDDVADFAIALRIKRHPYTPYKDPQGFIYVDDYKRNRLMRSDELYKFSDGTLTRLLSSLEDITKNINMEYLLKRRWGHIGKEKSSFHDQEHQQAAKGKEDDEVFGEIRWW